jgi:membrane protease YdiL (CAAX protease family)
MNDFKNPRELQFPIPVIIILGLFPGIIILLIVVVLSNPKIGINFSVYLSLMLAVALGLIPTELGILKYFAWKNNKKIKGIILFKEKTPLKMAAASIIIPFVSALAVFIIVSPYELKLWGNTFDFIPDWFKIYKTNFKELAYLKISLTLSFVFNGFLGPIVEELYFRGFLLPRMNKLGKFAPLVNTAIFSLYHLFTPWENITRILAITPLAYSVWINKNIKIGIIIHCSINVFSCIGTMAAVLG